jgi:hypothetical protein
MAMGEPLNVPPPQLKMPLIVTELVKSIVPLLVRLIVSLDAGTPTGVQLSAINQFWETEPFQEEVAAEHKPTFSKATRQRR